VLLFRRKRASQPAATGSAPAGTLSPAPATDAGSAAVAAPLGVVDPPHRRQD
jgi:hypothetical protein